MILFPLTAERHPSGDLFLSGKRALRVDQLPELEASHGGLLTDLSGRRIALRFRSQPRLAEAILLLDGICEQAILLPRDLADETAARFMASTGSKALVTDGPEGRSDGVEIPFEPVAGNPPSRTFTTTWLLPTSGTTGIPKLVPHTMESLCRTVKRDSARGKALRWGLFYELTRFAGMQVFLQALLGGSALVLPESADAPLDRQLELFGQMRVNALSATPTLWRKLLMSGGLDRIDLSLITLGGEIATQDILDALVRKYPDARITHVYASTEFGVGFAVSDRREGFPAAWLESRDFPFRIDEGSGELIYNFPQGSGVPLGTGDGVIIEGDRARFAGRLNGSINVGGNKVMPEEIERVLFLHPAVAMATVSGRKSPIVGQLPQADVVLNAGHLPTAETKKSIVQHCRKHLDPFKVPAIIGFVDALNHSTTGKILRR